MTIEQQTQPPVHDIGCRCWPHVSQSDALNALVEAARLEYRESVRLRNEADQWCQVQDCDRHHSQFTEPGLYLCGPHSTAVLNGYPVTTGGSGA